MGSHGNLAFQYSACLGGGAARDARSVREHTAPPCRGGCALRRHGSLASFAPIVHAWRGRIQGVARESTPPARRLDPGRRRARAGIPLAHRPQPGHRQPTPPAAAAPAFVRNAPEARSGSREVAPCAQWCAAGTLDLAVRDTVPPPRTSPRAALQPDPARPPSSGARRDWPPGFDWLGSQPRREPSRFAAIRCAGSAWRHGATTPSGVDSRVRAATLQGGPEQ